MFLDLIEKESEFNGIEWALLAAIVMTESAENPFAMRYEEKYRYLVDPARFAKRLGITEATESTLQKFSFGLCQLMGGLLRELGFDSELPKALDPGVNLSYGARNLKRLNSRFPGNTPMLISAYNAGTPVIENGKFRNQEYVNRVLSYYDRFRKFGA